MRNIQQFNLVGTAICHLANAKLVGLNYLNNDGDNKTEKYEAVIENLEQTGCKM